MSDLLVIDERVIELDGDGHLKDPGQWSEQVAAALARRDRVELEQAHWWLIRFVRDHYRRYHMPPLMRVVIAALRDTGAAEQASSRYLYRLFPDGPIRLACKYGGLPPPESCI